MNVIASVILIVLLKLATAVKVYEMALFVTMGTAVCNLVSYQITSDVYWNFTMRQQWAEHSGCVLGRLTEKSGHSTNLSGLSTFGAVLSWR